MPLPSLHTGSDGDRAWSLARAAAYGGAIGAFAAMFRNFGPLRDGDGVPSVASVLEIFGAALGFALLCAGAAALRNFIARRLIWR
jgi:hypothetical protein